MGTQSLVLRAVAALGSSALTASILLGASIGGAVPASAAPTVPPWEPDANAAAPYANVIFFDANGNQVTSGTNDLSNPFAWAVATTAADSGSTKSQLIFSKPQFANPPNPALWGGVSEGGPTVFSPSVTGAPASVTSFAPTYPVVKSAANISTFAASQGTDPTAGYTNIIQVRVQDTAIFGTTTYWDTDIAYNTTSSPTTIDGVSVPANGWAQIFPNVTPTTTGLTTSATGGTLSPGSPITLTASVPAADPGTVYFYDGTTLLSSVAQSGGSAAYTYTPAQSFNSYTAQFVPGPNPGDETGANTTSANIVSGSSGSTTVSGEGGHVPTSTSLAESSTSATPTTNDTETLTATVTENNSANPSDVTGLTGSVQFFDNGSPIGSPVATTVSGTSGTATYATKLPAGSQSLTAKYTPSASDSTATLIYDPSTSSAVVVAVTQAGPCANPGSSCSDPQNIQVTVGPGTLTLTTPYTSASPFVLPKMALSPDGTYFQSSATFPATNASGQIQVTSTAAPAYAWTLSVAATPLTSPSGTIPASGLGLTGGALLNKTGTGAYPGTVTFKDIPALNPSPTAGPTNGPGLSGTAQTFATSSATDGTALMDGTLTLYAATNTPSGTYNGTVSLSVS